MWACTAISGQQIFINIPLFTFIYTLLSLKYYAPDTRASVNICHIILTPVPYSISYIWCNASEPSCVSLCWMVYISQQGFKRTISWSRSTELDKMWIKPQHLVCIMRMTSIMSTSLVVVCLGLMSLWTIFQSYHDGVRLVATERSVLTFIVLPHWSIMPQTPDTWHDTTPSHIIVTLPRPVLAHPRKS